jgi:aldehyde:ferredoxin oxidoreductase
MTIELRDATRLWALRQQNQKTNQKRNRRLLCTVASIGIAGEKLSKIACIINDKTRAAGRSGLGGSHGSKTKTIAVRGTNDVAISKPKNSSV